MNNFNDIIGHKEVIHHMKSALRSGKISHAYIIEGQVGMGKRLIADSFAKALQCEKDLGEACNQCDSCRLFDGNNHPDIVYVETDKKKGIGVDDIREQLNSDINIRPYRYPYKIYIIEQADSMTEQAQNAMLKTIEEPPEYGIVFLLAENSNRFLQTILSRCVLLSLKPVKKQSIINYLVDKGFGTAEEAAIYASFARGSIGMAVKLCESESFHQMREDIIKSIELVIGKNDYELLELAGKMTAYKEDYITFFDLFITWLRDLLVIKKINNENYLIHLDKYNILLKQGDDLSYNRICGLIENVEKIREMQRVNVNFQLSLETMLLNY